MRGYLLDTHVLLWAAFGSPRLPAFARSVLADSRQLVAFSVVSLWEIILKSGADRPDFRVDAAAVRTYARMAGLGEVAVTGEHVLGVRELEPLHHDPFDRLLLAQAGEEQLVLLTVDRKVLRYGEHVKKA
ncbi:type II toxin-antitoxin system VapC family toxin [Georgenia yuyongxinii]|uniref:Type II toxin-antitoxin system VapC family toxin n=1 Tax=Georgenia yuyongxinii TaxID=2589797 RepID=A0A552WUZ9_9MICO|nr:type II toxin-antitoxin system VapC family toxin [Georgenia yuyongxinii]TRW46612.1 type II toxin-antitoxin system VapC family toxin [Georgenia yuyongxinii]